MNKFHVAFFAGILAAMGLTAPVHSQDSSKPMVPDSRGGLQAMKNSGVLTDFQVIEFRRYVIREGEREHFALYFESYFPEAFQQLGAVAVGEFLERGDPSRFTWLRAFHNMDDRAKANALFYFGPVWREHAATLNSLMIDSDNVLLLRPLSRDRSIAVLPAVDPVKEGNGARGIAIAQIFAVKADNVEAFAQQAESTFVRYREAGAYEAGVLVTLDKPNNFPQLPVRTDGPYLVWLGVVENEQTLKSFARLVDGTQSSLYKTGLLRTTPEFIVLDPTKRSRLRWITDDQPSK
jgi:hypothetical protein